MIPGIVASSAGPLVSNGGGVTPENATAYANFISGEYAVDGISVTAADVIDHPEFIDGSGLNISSNRVLLIGDFLARASVSEVTFVMDYSSTETANVTQTAFLRGTSSDGYIDDIQDNQFTVAFGDENSRYIESTAVSANPAVRRVAITKTNDYNSISVNGGAVQTFAFTASPSAVAKAAIGGPPWGAVDFEGHIRLFAVMPVTADIDLPGLSAL